MESFPLTIAQLTDTHLFADLNQQMLGCVTAHSFAAVLEALKAQLPLDGLLLTGDLSQDDSLESYRLLWEAIAPLQIPTYWLPGNHDQNRAACNAVLGQPPFSHSPSIRIGGWQMLLLDTQLPQQVQGRLSENSLDWLETQLDCSAQTPTLIALHHPPLPIHSPWMDAMGLENAADFLALVDRHPQVKVVLNGHIHQAFEQERNGVLYLGTPSTSMQFRPQTERLEIDEARPGFRLLRLFPQGQVETQVIRLS